MFAMSALSVVMSPNYSMYICFEFGLGKYIWTSSNFYMIFSYISLYNILFLFEFHGNAKRERDEYMICTYHIKIHSM